MPAENIARFTKYDILFAVVALCVVTCPFGAPRAFAQDKIIPANEELTVGAPGPRFEANWRFEDPKPPYRVTFAQFGGSAQVVEGLLGGGLDLGIAGDIGVIAAQATGSPIRIVAALRDNSELLRLLVPKGSKVEHLSDLRGKTIAVAKGTSAHTLVLRLIRAEKLNTSDFKWAYLSNADAGPAFQQGNVDAWVTWDPFAATAELKWDAKTISHGTKELSGYTYWVARNDLFAGESAKAEAARDFISKYAVANGSEMKRLPEWSDKLATAMKLESSVSKVVAERYHFQSVTLGAETVASYSDTAELLLQQGIIASLPDVERAFDFQSVNPAVESALNVAR